MSEMIRLQKYLAQCGVASRRKAETLISEGRISVDGRVVVNMGEKIDPLRQCVLFDGKEVKIEEEKVYILLNKPKGYVTTLSDPQGRPIVTSLVKNIPVRLFPVGRLDIDTVGALLLTNDGELAQRIQHPSYEVTKTYEALVAGRPGPKALQALESGIMLEGKMTAPASLRILKSSERATLIETRIHEGRKRQVKKMYQAVGHPVLQLKRLAYGALQLGSLPEGRYRTLTAKDLKKIFKKYSFTKGKIAD